MRIRQGFFKQEPGEEPVGKVIQPYDFSDIPHDDQLNTGRRMEVEELLCGAYGDLPISEVEVQLNTKIQQEW